MLKMSIKNFRTFLEGKIKATESCSRFSESEKCTRLQVLDDIADLEIMDEVYDRHDTGWLLQEATFERSAIENKLEANKARYSEAYKEYESVHKEVEALTETLSKYKKGKDDGGNRMPEKDVLETIRELYQDLRTAKAQENKYYKVWSEEMALKRVSNALHKLMGILNEPEGYFWYLREA